MSNELTSCESRPLRVTSQHGRYEVSNQANSL